MLELLMLLWTEDNVTYEGKYYQVNDLTIDPKPAQQPHPPIWMGGGSMTFEKKYGQKVTNIEPVLRRIAKYAETWVPHAPASLEMINSDWEKIQALLVAIHTTSILKSNDFVPYLLELAKNDINMKVRDSAIKTLNKTYNREVS